MNQNQITRPLEVIETEINFYKQQTAQGIIEIGKRLIEAKSQLQHGEWGKWLEEKVEFSQMTANRFMKVSQEFSNSTAMLNLGQSKLFLLLDIPQDQREDFIEQHNVESLTTRQLQEEIKKVKEEVKQQVKAETEELIKQKEMEFNKEKKELEQKLNTLTNNMETKIEEKLKIKELALQKAIEEENDDDIKSLKDEIAYMKNTVEQIESAKSDLQKEKDDYKKKYQETLDKLVEKNNIINQFMGTSVNYQLMSNVNETTLKMLNFVKEMAQYDYISETFNDLPNTTRKEYITGVYAVLKWSRNILNNVKHDDVLGINEGYINDIQINSYEIID